MFLGIEYNKWHCILAVIGVVGLFVIGFIDVFMPLRNVWEENGLSGFVLGAIYGVSVLFVLALQGTNESVQALDDELVQKYGSYENFQKNSRDDWKWFVLGVGIGSVLIGFFLTIVLFVI